MMHKAFALDWDAFDRLLRPILVRALATGDAAELIGFVEDHRERLADPDEVVPLPTDWRSVVDPADVQRLGDVALTRFYDPDADEGILYAWLPHVDGLPPAVQRALLGTPVRGGEQWFDPGRLGSYFQSPAQVRESAAAVEAAELDVGEDAEEFARFTRLVERSAACGLGLYVTF
jgi:hypothetical protein